MTVDRIGKRKERGLLFPVVLPREKEGEN